MTLGGVTLDWIPIVVEKDVKLSSVISMYQTRIYELQNQHRKFSIDTGETSKGKVANYSHRLLWESLSWKSLKEVEKCLCRIIETTDSALGEGKGPDDLSMPSYSCFSEILLCRCLNLNTLFNML